MDNLGILRNISPRGVLSQLTNADHGSLLAARHQLGPGDPLQSSLAPIEHRAWAREYVQANPLLGPLAVAMLIPGYQASKLVMPGGPEQTPPSLAQMVQGYAGILDGLVAIRKNNQ